MTQKILLTGAYGLMGTAIREVAGEFSGLEIMPCSHTVLDITDVDSVESNFDDRRPDIVLNCAGFTNLDRAEANPELATRVNCLGVENLSHACLKRNVKLIHLSTHGIFDGNQSIPYVESDLAKPLNVYAKTKFTSESVVKNILPEALYAIVRIAWPIGKNGNNFFNHIIRIAKEKGSVQVVSDQAANPTPSPLLARKLLEFIDEFNGTLHIATSDYCTRYELMRFALDKLKISCEISPVTSAQFPSSLTRPSFCAIATEREHFRRKLAMPSWKIAMGEYLKEGGNSDAFK